MDLLNLFGGFAIIYALIKCFNRAINDEKVIYTMHCDQVEDQQRNLYSLSKSHQLIMERVRIEDMALKDDFVPLEQQLMLDQWYNKVYQYSGEYFRILDVIEAGQKATVNKVVHLAERR